MSLQNTAYSYGSVAKFFHWLISPLVLLMLIAGFFLDDLPEDYKSLCYGLHKQIGIIILGLMVLRLLWRWVNPRVELPAGTPAWEGWLAHAVHYALYLFVILMPLAGWIGSVAGGRPPRFGDLALNLPIEPNKELAGTAFNFHEIIAYILIALISLHFLAAMYHHYVRRDNVLKRMLPGGKG